MAEPMLTIDDDDGWLSLGTDADAETSPAGVEDIELERMQATWTKPALPLLPEDLAITFDDEGSHFSNQPPTPNHAALLQSPTLSSPTAAGWLYSGEGALAFVPVPNSPRDADVEAAEALTFWAQCANAAFAPASEASPAARSVAASLVRAARRGGPCVDRADARAAHACVEACAPFAVADVDVVRGLLEASPPGIGLGEMARAVTVEAQRVHASRTERRAAWRPVAAWRAVQARCDDPPTFDESAECALRMWAALNDDPFHQSTHKSLEARTLACELAFLLSRLFTPADARGPADHVACLGREVATLLQRATLWAAEDVRVVLGLIAAAGAHPKASVALLAKLCAALVAATRRKKRPAKFKPRQFAKYVEDAAPDSPKANGVNAAPEALLARVLATAIAQDGRELLFAGCSLETYEPTTFYAKERNARLARLASAVLDPAPRGDASFEWGSDDETRLGWRFRPAFAAPLPSDLRADVATPRGLVTQLARHNPLDATWTRQVIEFQRIVEAAEETRCTQHAWLPEYTLHVSSTISMRCCEFVARDPDARATCSATVVAFATRDA